MRPDRRLRGGETPTGRLLLVWFVLSAILLAIALPRILQGQFPDPDDVLRLVQVRDLLGGQPWFDLHQYRIDPPAGTAMHWSRLVDIPLALVILLLSPVIGTGAAETVAMLLVPLIVLGVIVAVIGRLAWRLFDLRVAGLACLAIGLLPPLVFQIQPLRIDHHGWQVAAVAIALWACSWRFPARGGAVAGFAMAAGISISLEPLPLAAAFAGILFLRLLRDRKERWWLVAYMQSLALGLGLLFMLTKGWGDLAQYCDTVSPAHLGFFLIAAIGTGVIAAPPKAPALVTVSLFAVVAGLGLGFFAVSAPACTGSPFAQLDPLVRDFWYLNVSEGRPVWEQAPGEAIPAMLQLVVALCATAVLRHRSRHWLRQWWGEYFLLLVAAIVLSVFVWRSAAFAALLACIPLGWLLSRLLDRMRLAEATGGKLAVCAAIILLLVPSAPVVVGKGVARGNMQEAPVVVRESGCEIRASALLLNRLPEGTIFAPLDIGPSILLKSHHAVIATGHHRAEPAMRDVILAYTGRPAEARRIMIAHDADYVAMCTDLVEASLLADANPDGLMAALVNGQAPAWLERVALDGPEEFAVWRIRK